MLLRSDGTAVACGDNRYGQCNIPPLDAGLSYTQVSAGRWHTVLLRSDGTAVACGRNNSGQCNIAQMEPGTEYVGNLLSSVYTVLQVDFRVEDDKVSLLCLSMVGDEVLRLNPNWSDLAWDTHKHIAREVGKPLQSLELILPDGQLLANVCQAQTETSIADIADGPQHAKRSRRS